MKKKNKEVEVTEKSLDGVKDQTIASQQNMINELTNLVNVKTQLVNDLDRLLAIRSGQVDSLQKGRAYFLKGEDIVDMVNEAREEEVDQDGSVKIRRMLSKVDESLPDISIEFVFDVTGDIKLLSPVFNISTL